MNFKEAAEVAKLNPGSVLSRDESGGFYVRGLDGKRFPDNSQKSPCLFYELEERENRIAQLEQELSKLRLNIDIEVESRVEGLKGSIEKEWAQVQEVKSKLQQLVSQNETNLRKLRLLEQAYAERFGAAEVKEVSVIVESRDVCSRCGGDGGVNGGCGKCDGTGWAISRYESVREEVQFK